LASAHPTRFPSGVKALGDYLHARDISFGVYTAESTGTCGGWTGSRGYELREAQTFAEWGVDYFQES
jgi:alpha-galactosidase